MEMQTAKPVTSVLVTLAVLVVFMGLLYLIGRGEWNRGAIALAVLLLIGATAGAHVLLVVQEKASLLVLPVGWLLCLLINYIYSYHIASLGFFGPSFAFNIIAIPFILPPGAVAIILFIIQMVKYVKAS